MKHLVVAILLAIFLTPQAEAAVARKPYMGWSSWSMQSSTYPGLNPQGKHSFLTEANVIRQADYLAANLKRYGYRYINMDAGWWMDWQWNTQYDGYGRPMAFSGKFPHGMKWMADHLHGKGLKAGIYLAVGLAKDAYAKGDLPIHGAPGCTIRQIVQQPLRATNGWDNAWKIDYSQPCAQKYVDSLARMIADWGYDFLKFDGVGPGAGKNDPDHDNRADVEAMSKALRKTGRPIIFEISAWPLDYVGIDTWKRYANAWRAHTDVECYCDTLVTWDSSVKKRWEPITGQWLAHAGPGGWVDFDSINVGNGQMDGINVHERKSSMTLWAVSAAPLYIGDDLTRLDAYGKSLLTNPEVLAQDQQGIPARRISEQLWHVRNRDGTHTVALFNLGDTTANVTVSWRDLGFSRASNMRDLWSRKNLGPAAHGFTASLPAHGSRLLKVRP